MARTSLLQWLAPRLYKTTKAGNHAFTTNYAVQDTYITNSGHGLTVGDMIEFIEGGTLQSPLVENKIYTVFDVISTSNFTVTLDGVTEVVLTNDGTNDSDYTVYTTNVTLENFTILQDAPENRIFWHESIINNHREVVNADKMHWIIEMQLNLFKEDTLTTRRTNFDELFGYLYQDVYISRNNENGIAAVVIRDSSGVPVEFVMDSFVTSFIAQSKFEDQVTITLRSKDPIDLSETL